MSRFTLFLLLTSAAVAFQAAPPAATPSTAADLARVIREAGMDPTECYRVRDLNFVKDDIKVYFNDGYLMFSKPVLGRRLSALFTTDVEGGDGEVIVIPPTRSERQSLATFTQSPNLDEHVRTMLMILTDDSMEGLRTALGDQGSAKKVPEAGALLAERWGPVVANISAPMQMRLVADLWSARPEKTGLAFFAIGGATLGSFDILSDARANHRMIVRQRVERDGHDQFNVWTDFLPRRVTSKNSPVSNPIAAHPPAESDWEFTLSNYRIESEIANDMGVRAVTHVSLRVGPDAVRAFPFDIARNMQVTAVRIDGVPAELMQGESQRGRIGNGQEEVEFLAVSATPLSPGSTHEFEFEHHGNVIATRGEGVYFVSARGSWYPHMPGQFATYDLTFRYPKRLTLVAAGDPVEDRIDGDSRITHRRMNVLAGAAGFDLGIYEKVTGTAAGVNFEVYGNRNLEESMHPPVTLPSASPIQQPPFPRRGATRLPPQPVPVPFTPDPVARLRAVADDVAASLEFFSGMFGPPAMKTLAVAPIPGGFGQGFPGLVYLSTFAYMDSASRPAALRDSKEQVFYSDLMVPHEVAHQWWGSVISTAHSEDEWLLEALANYSSLLWLEKKKSVKEMVTVLDGYRSELLDKDAQGKTYESAGPIVWGDRLSGQPTSRTWRSITYGKGTWIMHMLRRRMGDDAFFKLLAELRRRYEFKLVTTADFQALARELRPRSLTAEGIDAFFDNWVYATGIPTLKLHYTVSGVAPAVKLSGSIDQSGAGDDFSMDAPVEVQFAKGSTQTIWVRTTGDDNTFTANLRQTPVRVVIPDDVLVKK